MLLLKLWIFWRPATVSFHHLFTMIRWMAYWKVSAISVVESSTASIFNIIMEITSADCSGKMSFVYRLRESQLIFRLYISNYFLRTSSSSLLPPRSCAVHLFDTDVYSCTCHLLFSVCLTSRLSHPWGWKNILYSLYLQHLPLPLRKNHSSFKVNLQRNI